MLKNFMLIFYFYNRSLLYLRGEKYITLMRNSSTYRLYSADIGTLKREPQLIYYVTVRN